LRELQQKLEKE